MPELYVKIFRNSYGTGLPVFVGVLNKIDNNV